LAAKTLASFDASRGIAGFPCTAMLRQTKTGQLNSIKIFKLNLTAIEL